MFAAPWPVAAGLVVCLSIGTGAALAQTPDTPLTLDAARALAERANPRVVAARLRKPVDTAGIDVAGLRPNPELSYELGRDTPRHSFTVTLPVELGGRRSRRLDLARATVTTGEAAVALTLFEVQNEVRRAYFELAAAESRREAATDLRGLALRARDAAQARFTLGDVPRLEVLRAELELASADNDVSAAQAALDAGRARLNTLLGRAPDTAVTTANALTTRGLPPGDGRLTQANATNAELAAFDAAIAEQTARRALAKSSAGPDASIGAGMTSGVPDEFPAGWRATAALTLPLFSRQPTVTVEDAALAALRAERAAAAAALAGQLAETLPRVVQTGIQLDRYERDILPRALEVERMSEDAYRSGQSNLATLLDALRASRELRYRALEVALEYQLALADLERALGAVIK